MRVLPDEVYEEVLALLENAHNDRSKDDAVTYNPGKYNVSICDAMYGIRVAQGQVEGPRTLMWSYEGMSWEKAPDFVNSFDEALRRIPDFWWLWGMHEVRGPVMYSGDVYKVTGKWEAFLQHNHQGRLTSFQSATPGLALSGCILAVMRKKRKWEP